MMAGCALNPISIDMRFLTYKDIETRRVKSAFAKLRLAIEANDFRSPSIKKLVPTPYWRAKLDDSNRVLLQFARYGNETVCLALEVIENHAYEKSRFLRGAKVDEAKIEQTPAFIDSDATMVGPDVVPLRWLHAKRGEFELLDKPIVFDDAQEAVRRLPAPVVVVGSAGSGKTAVTLTKLREAQGRVLYVTHSAYLAQSARSLYNAHGYDNTTQEVEFLSYRELIETLRVPTGREVMFPAFRTWVERHRQALRTSLGGIDAHALFEEFRGVLSASAAGPLDLSTYLGLGARQSLLSGAAAREAAYTLFGRYREWLSEAKLFDLNLVAHEWRALAEPTYDFVVIDEVQDLTSVQLALVLACLKKPGEFLLCGDSNQIVHPNFFSWAAVRTLFWQGLAGDAQQHQALSVLQANFRNTKAVTELANALLKIKQARFGSIDRESNYLVQCASSQEGETRLLPARDALLRELDARTRASIRHAVIVLRDEDKPAAREHFRTPLVFSVHEAKGLEYPHVILYSLVSGQRAAYAEVCEGVTPADLQVQELDYCRARDKADKSLELYKFYVNALYVAMTRAVESLVMVESDTRHPLFALLGLQVQEASTGVAAPAQVSTRDEWAQEARKLEQQGKEEQARAIRETFLQTTPVPWVAWSDTLMGELLPRALDATQPSQKPRQALFDYALWHGQHVHVEQLASQTNFASAKNLAPQGLFDGLFTRFNAPFELPLGDFRDWQKKRQQNLERVTRTAQQLRQRYLQPYTAKNIKDILRACDTYGVDHRCPTGATPLSMAAVACNLPLVDALLERGADVHITDEFGHSPWLAVLNQAATDVEFAKRAIAPLFDRLAPAVIDVQTNARLVRLERHQAEYWVLSFMLAQFKTRYSALRSHLVPHAQASHKYQSGYFADELGASLGLLPEHLWGQTRNKRSYLNGVLARAACQSTYQPSRQLWVRTRVGYYMPNPLMQLRVRSAVGNEPGWQPVYEVLNATWVLAGTENSDEQSALLQNLQMLKEFLTSQGHR